MLQTDHRTDGPTNIAPYKVACTKLKRNKEKKDLPGTVGTGKEEEGSLEKTKEERTRAGKKERRKERVRWKQNKLKDRKNDNKAVYATATVTWGWVRVVMQGLLEHVTDGWMDQ